MEQHQSNTSSGIIARLDAAGHPRFSVTAAVVVLLALVLFAPSLTSGTFVNASDSILRLSLVSHVRHIPGIFGQDFMGFTDGRYRPFSYAVLALVRTFASPDDVVFWNLWLLAFHVLNALLVYAVARHFTDRPTGPLLALGVFLLHPLASAFGSRINLFPHVLGGTFYLGALLSYLRYVRTRRLRFYLPAVLLFAVGLLTSHSVLTLPLLLLLYELFYERTGIVRTIERLLPFGACAVAAGFCFVMFHPHRVFYICPPLPPARPLRYWAYSFAAGGLDTFVGLLRGRPLRVAVSRLLGGMYSTWNLIPATLALAAWLAVSIQALLAKRWVAVGTFLLLLGVLPQFSSTHNFTPDYLFWTFRYLPLVGFALLLGAVVDPLLTTVGRRLCLGVLAVAVAVLLAYGARLVTVNVHARNPEDYWRYALKMDPRSETASVNLGKVYLAKGDEKEALKHLFSPVVGSVRESCLAMAGYYSRTGERVAAVGHLGIADRETVFGLQFQEDALTSARVLYDAQAFDFAEQELGNVLMVDPRNTTALKMLGDIFLAKGYVPAAVGCFEEVALVNPTDTANTERLEALRRRLYDPEDLDRPATIVPPPPDWLRYAVTQVHSRRIFPQILRDAQARPDDPILQLVAGICLSEGGRHGPALAHVDRTVKAMPAYPFATVAKCYVAQNAGDIALAVKTIEEARQLTPRDAHVWLQFGQKRLEAGQPALAIAATQLALKGNPNKPQTHGVLAGLLVRQGRFPEALPHYREALHQPRARLGHIHNGLGYVLMCLGRLDEAVAHYRESISINPRPPVVYRNLAAALAGRQHFSESIGALEDGLRMAPDDVGLHQDLAWLLATAPQSKLRDGARAVRLAETALKNTRPVTHEMLDVLAAAYAEDGQFQKAVETARQAVRLAETQGKPRAADAYRQRLERYLRAQPLSP
ncbi:MAG TPA: tetratricopeptide repeat protein [Planctomycetota bacterium]|nr:tetratricopeptide repeat protein [Planctomycetota bacterium]